MASILTRFKAPSAADSNRWLVLALVCIAQFMVILDATIVNVALPSIQADLGFTSENLSWVINGYTLMFGGFLLLGGRMADLIGRRRLFLIGVALFSVASLADGLANSPETLVAARAFQGLGAALVSPAALSIITTTFGEGPDRTKAFGVWSAIAAGGGAVGLLLGGALTEALSWEWIFFVNVPIGILALLLSAHYLPESRLTSFGEGVKRSFDAVGALLVTSGLVLLTFAIVKIESWGFGDPRTLGVGAVALILIAAFVWRERSTRAPLVRLGIFRLRSLASANTVMLLIGGGLFSMFFFGSIYLQKVLGFSALSTGLAFLPMTGGIVVGSFLSQGLIARFGVKPIATAGLSLAAIGLILMTGISAGGTYAGEMLAPILLIAIGMGLTFVPVTLAATANVRDEDAGLASGILNTSQQIGGALGLATLSSLAGSRTSDLLASIPGAPSAVQHSSALVEGFQLAFTVGAGMLVVGALLLGFWLRNRDVSRAAAGEPVAAEA